MNPTRTLLDAAAIVLLLVATALGAHAALDEAPLFPAPTASTAATGGSGSSSGEYGIELGLLDKLMLHYESAGGIPEAPEAPEALEELREQTTR